MEPAWSVYIVRCRTGELYTGCTLDLNRRMRQHNAGKGARFTRTRRPVLLVYQERCRDRSSALKREVEIKKMSRWGKIRLIQSASAMTA